MAPSFSPKLVEELAAALPPDGANPIGTNARRIIVNKIRGMTPGNYSQMFGTGPAFRVVFFPKYAPDAAEGLFAGYTGISDATVSQAAIALLCHQMYQVTRDVRPQLLINEINGKIASWNAELRSRTSRWYAYVASITDGDIKKALATFGDEPSRVSAVAHYRAGLTSESWINDKVTQGPAWTNREWELFHHWIKLAALGCPDADVDATIQQAIDTGLPVPAAVRPGVWQRWSGWLGPDVTGGDFADATEPLLATKCIAAGRSVSCIAEAASYEFTARTQPGTIYRRAPSSSCLAPGAQVVMSDGSLRAIEDVRAGDRVASRTEDREVLLVSAPPRGQRPLYRIGGTGFAFTATDAFLIHPGSSPATYAAVDPAALSRAVPTFAQFGVRDLRTSVLSRYADGRLEPYTPDGVAVADETPPILHGVYVDPGDDGRSEYFVGDADRQLLVSSEIPRFLAAPVTAEALVEVLRGSAPTILAVLAAVPDDGFADLLDIGLSSISRTLLTRIGGSLRPADAADTAIPSAASTLAMVRGFAGDFGGTAEKPYDWRLGTLLDFFLARFGVQFQGVIHLGWRSYQLAEGTTGVVLAVSLYGLELFDDDGMAAADAEFQLALRLQDAVSIRTAPVEPAASTDRSFYVSDTISYFPEWRALIDAPPDRDWILDVTLASTHDNRHYTAEIPLPPVISHGYEFLRGAVRNDSGAVVGQVSLDVRTLDADVWAQEIRAQQAWSPTQEPAIASTLATQATAYVVANFADAVRTFAGLAVTAEAQDAFTTAGSSQGRQSGDTPAGSEKM